MDDRIKAFLEELRNRLAGLPDTEIEEALAYYDEYINDALDEGEEIGKVLSRFDSPAQIAAMIKAEASIRNARNNPGLRNYSRVLKHALTNITRPFSVMMFSVFILITYSIALVLFCGAIGFAAAACVILPGSVYEALRIPTRYMAEIISFIGMGVFSAALCLLTAIGFFVLCRLFIRLSSGLVGRILNRSRKSLPGVGSDAAETIKRQAADKPVKSSTPLMRICLTALVAGFSVAMITGLPLKLFMIFNSMEPASVIEHTWEYDASAVNNLSITTAQSHIRLIKSNSNKISVTYRQPDWMESDISCKNGQLSFSEKSNNRMPLFPLVTMHESQTYVTVALPAGFTPSVLRLESRGGFIHLETTDFNVQASTYTGNIYINLGNAAVPPALSASTSTGFITANGKNVGKRTSAGLIYTSDNRGGKSVKLETVRGSISIERLSISQ